MASPPSAIISAASFLLSQAHLREREREREREIEREREREREKVFFGSAISFDCNRLD